MLFLVELCFESGFKRVNLDFFYVLNFGSGVDVFVESIDDFLFWFSCVYEGVVYEVLFGWIIVLRSFMEEGIWWKLC